MADRPNASPPRVARTTLGHAGQWNSSDGAPGTVPAAPPLPAINAVAMPPPDQSFDRMDAAPTPWNAMPSQTSQPQVVSQVVSQMVPYGQDRQLLQDRHSNPAISSSPAQAHIAISRKVYLGLLEAASLLEKIEIRVSAEHEDQMIRALVEARTWKSAHIKVASEFRPDFLLRLDQALSADGQRKSIFLEFDSKTPWTNQPLMPGGRAIDIVGMFLKEGAHSPSFLLHYLSQPNPQLDQFLWDGQSDTTPFVEALSKGSHQLRDLGFCPVPLDSDKFLTMLLKKPLLQNLTLVAGKFGLATGILAEVLSAAPALTYLRLVLCQFSMPSLQNCASVLADSRLEHLDLAGVWFEDPLIAKPSFPELEEGIRSAPRLSQLTFRRFDDSSSNLTVLEAFAQNPVASTVLTLKPDDSLRQEVDRLNLVRLRDGWEALTIALTD